MITKKDIDNFDIIHREIERIKRKIRRYKPSEIVIDSVRGSSSEFPYIEHSVIIEGIEYKKDSINEYYKELSLLEDRLLLEKKRILEELKKIDDLEIIAIINCRIDGLTYVEIANELEYNCEDTPRKKLYHFFEQIK